MSGSASIHELRRTGTGCTFMVSKIIYITIMIIIFGAIRHSVPHPRATIVILKDVAGTMQTTRNTCSVGTMLFFFNAGPPRASGKLQHKEHSENSH